MLQQGSADTTVSLAVVFQFLLSRPLSCLPAGRPDEIRARAPSSNAVLMAPVLKDPVAASLTRGLEQR